MKSKHKSWLWSKFEPILKIFNVCFSKLIYHCIVSPIQSGWSSLALALRQSGEMESADWPMHASGYDVWLVISVPVPPQTERPKAAVAKIDTAVQWKCSPCLDSIFMFHPNITYSYSQLGNRMLWAVMSAAKHLRRPHNRTSRQMQLPRAFLSPNQGGLYMVPRKNSKIHSPGWIHLNPRSSPWTIVCEAHLWRWRASLLPSLKSICK